MVLVSAIRAARKAGSTLIDAIQHSGIESLRTILMTALVASVGFIPMATSSGAGAEVQRPLATVVIGGVITSTLFTLVVLPALYQYFVLRLYGNHEYWSASDRVRAMLGGKFDEQQRLPLDQLTLTEKQKIDAGIQ
jgi:hypothetical protein